MSKLNCWEFKKCGREPGGARVLELGVCPAAIETRLDGIHEGKNAGRSCWILNATLCEDKVQGTYGQKFSQCSQCPFYKKVKSEEETKFQFSPLLLKRLGQWPETNY
jgi:hypothetical protein